MNLYIFGNGNLEFYAFTRWYVPAISSALKAGAGFIVCDFRGADTLTMEYLKTRTVDVEVLHVGEQPRYLPDRYKTRTSEWTVTGGFGSDRDRDEAAMQRCTHVLAMDFNSSDHHTTGTAKMLERAMLEGRTLLSPPLYYWDAR